MAGLVIMPRQGWGRRVAAVCLFALCGILAWIWREAPADLGLLNTIISYVPGFVLIALLGFLGWRLLKPIASTGKEPEWKEDD